LSFESGTTIRILINTRDFSGEPSDVDQSPTISIWDGLGVKRIFDQSSTRDSIGSYHLDVTLDEAWQLGNWVYEVRASIAGKPLVARGSFRVVKTGGALG
jgi:uncharacterized protein YfaS (alpha-2-macroglobulin family)